MASKETYLYDEASLRTMRKILIFLALIFLAACQTQVVIVEKNVTINVSECNPPYYEYTAGDCCLDKDVNEVCDREELPEDGAISPQPSSETPEVLERVIVQKTIQKFKDTVKSYSFKKGKKEYFVMGDLVHVKLDRVEKLTQRINNTEVAITDIFVDRTLGHAKGYCDPRTEGDIMGSYQADRSPCKKIIDVAIPLNYKEYNPELPEDWLYKYVDTIPVIVETSDQYVRATPAWKYVNPVLHFIEGEERITIRVDAKTGIPLKIETDKGTATLIQSYDWVIHNKVTGEDVQYQTFAY